MEKKDDLPGEVLCWCVPPRVVYMTSGKTPCTWPECPNAKMPDPESWEPPKLWRPAP